jgi:hydroxymethylpyrimidine pyrophosphatase-like HAD family hydrolase
MGVARFSGLVLDYDGTVCATGSGHSPPAWPERAELLRLLAAGQIVGFASGRGRSLHRELRGWVPESRWPQVIVGMYSGGVILRLTEELPAHGEIPRPDVSGEAAAGLAEAQARLSAYSRTVRLDVRLGQVTVKACHEATSHQALTALTRSVLALPPLPAIRVLESAHAVDIVPARISKADVITAASDLAGGPVLAIGDQGQPGGNDFALLAHQLYSLSVDRCSPDPTRCWNLAPPGVSGPAALRRYLTALHLDSSGAATCYLG